MVACSYVGRPEDAGALPWLEAEWELVQARPIVYLMMG